jgi:hypothetical protein
LGYNFSKADVRFLATLPPIKAADGYATVDGQTYTMVMAAGTRRGVRPAPLPPAARLVGGRANGVWGERLRSAVRQGWHNSPVSGRAVVCTTA